jgi:16S rRNA (adenine1518-N6/adenine1519-N6)-dimethyltransferase
VSTPPDRRPRHVDSRRPSPAEPVAEARSNSGAAPGPGLQQHDLKPRVATAIVDRIDLVPGGIVVEVGPGRGALTAALLAKGAIVHAVELDDQRCEALRERFADAIIGEQFHLIQADALRSHPQPQGPWQVVANPPFHHTAALVRGWLLGTFTPEPPQRIDCILQREAVAKFGGARGNENRSSVLMRLAGFPRLVGELARFDVTPLSRVDLAHWAFKRENRFTVKDLRLVDAVLEKAFAGTHTMRESLRGLATKVQIERQAKEQGWDPNAHPRTLTPEAWVPLARLLHLCGKI